MKTDDIRSSYLEFFRQRDHVVERSDLIVPSNDPTLLFSSAGMVQFKSFYSGEVPVPYRRATTSQKCLRAGGKANDLDEVGKTSRHMTFFEMLGNFSFGDYFKQQAIQWGWEYCAEVVKMDMETVWISVFEDDDEAYDIWEKEIGVPSSRIVRLGAKENFWGPAGDTGACGPCSELHVDRGEEFGCGEPDCAPGCEGCERFIEFWNLVFPQFDQQLDGSRPALKNRGIDTGMGLERLAALLQGVETVFDTDGIIPIINATQSMTKIKYKDNPTPFRVIADHARALSFMIADGVLPGNEGRGYVERRLLRRAARFGRELGLEKPFLHEVVPTVIDLMSHQFPELSEKRTQIEKIIHTEEERFGSTLARGMDLLEDIFEKMDKAGEKTVAGDKLFRLHDTYGFPLDLATDIAEDRQYSVDRDGFEASMQHQRQQARSAWAGSGQESISPVYKIIHDEIGDTEFIGYETTECTANVLAIVKDNERVDKLSEGEEGDIILDKTPFYAESGGQVGDVGIFDSVSGNAHISSTKALIGKTTLHSAKVTSGSINVGNSLSVQVDEKLREAIQNHHTATHLLQSALQDTLGAHVHQAGSLVASDHLRFDFTHFEGIDTKRVQDIERTVNRYIRENTSVTTEEMPIDKARDAGAMALFGEKYADVVRVVTIGDTSMELCGGTHIDTTGKIGYFKILSEVSVSSGVRRIEAVCGEPCVDVLLERDQNLSNIARMLNIGQENVADRVISLLEENKQLGKDVARWKQTAATGGAVDHMSKVVEVKGIKVLATEVQDQDANALKLVMDKMRDKMDSGIVVLGSSTEGKVSLCIAVSKDLIPKIKAGDIVKQLAPIVGGGGGGRPDMAMAGGKHPEKLPEAISKAAEVIADLLTD